MSDYSFSPDALPPLYGGDTDLSVDAVAEAIGWTPARIEGLLGPYTVATVTLQHDHDGYPPTEWAVPDGAGVHVAGEPYLSHGDYDALEYTGPDYPDALDRAWDHITERYPARMAGAVLERYARLHGYTVRQVDLTGYTQSEWVSLAIVEPVDGDRVDVDTLADYMRGDVYGVTVAIAHPYGGEWEESMWDVYGDDGVRAVCAELLAEGVDSIRADVRACA